MANDLVGKDLGPYHIVGRLGQGAMGAVYRGVHRESNKPVAIKVMLAEVMQANPTIVKRFEREIELLTKFRHPNIVRVYGADQQDGIRYMAMELVEGKSLEDLLAGNRKLDLAKAIFLARQLCEALQDIHAVGVVHRDLKPANLIVSLKDKKLKLADFGIAKDITATHSAKLTDAEHTVGTLAYMSPEQLAGEELTRKSDLYALGIVLYQMVTGRLPFEAETVFDYLNKRMEGKFPPPSKVNPEIPRELDRLICELMEHTPANRPRDAYVVLDRLNQLWHGLKEGTLTGNTKIPAASSEVVQVDANLLDTQAPTVQAGRMRALSSRLGTFLNSITGTLAGTSKSSKRKKRKKGDDGEPIWESPWFLGSAIVLLVGLIGWVVLTPRSCSQLLGDAKRSIDRTLYREAWEILQTVRDRNCALSEQETQLLQELSDHSLLGQAEAEMNRYFATIFKSKLPDQSPESLIKCHEASRLERAGFKLAAEEKFNAVLIWLNETYPEQLQYPNPDWTLRKWQLYAKAHHEQLTHALDPVARSAEVKRELENAITVIRARFSKARDLLLEDKAVEATEEKLEALKLKEAMLTLFAQEKDVAELIDKIRQLDEHNF